MRILILVAVGFLPVACEDSRSEIESLDGVYHRFGGFESETVVLQGDTFEWWFTWDETLPDIFPIEGKFSRLGSKLELTYEIPEAQKYESALISPPRFLELVEHPSHLIRSHRFLSEDFIQSTNESREDFEASHNGESSLLFKTGLKLGEDITILRGPVVFEDREMVVKDQRARFQNAFSFMAWDVYEQQRSK